jgi:SAM-dependent methyltransferase
MNLNKSPIFNKLRCPFTGQNLRLEGDMLVNDDGSHNYTVSQSGIPLFAELYCSKDAERQKEHYNKNALQYLENLGYPHTLEYLRYLDRVFIENVVEAPEKVAIGVGVDISQSMLELAKVKHEKHQDFLFIQADVTSLPFQNSSFRAIFIFGGIHHVPDRDGLFKEVARVLKPGGRFYFREPVSDFFLWRWLRAIIYKWSPALDAETERPLLWEETVPILKRHGLQLKTWKTYGFFGFCIFMNSDVLVFNRLFRFLPGICSITKFFARFDDLILKIPGFEKLGLQVVGVAEKPMN